MKNLAYSIIVKCEKCGKLGDDHDIPTVAFPDGIYRTLCQDCFKKETNIKKDKIKVLICGDRNWNNFKVIEDFIITLPKDAVIIHGDCRGADKISGFLAKKHGYEVIPFPAHWETYGLKAGPIRNQQMIDEGKPDLVVAFHNDLKNSKGTKDMVDRANSVGIQVKIISEELSKI